MPVGTTVAVAASAGAAAAVVAIAGVVAAKVIPYLKKLPKVNSRTAERAGFPGRDVRWLQKNKYMVSLDDKDKLNSKWTVKRGSECLPSRRFRDIAVKHIEKTESTEDELATLLELNHKNVVKLIGYGVTGGEELVPYQYMIMELCDLNLTVFMEDRNQTNMTVDTFKSISGQLLDGLGFIHGKRLIHRDIKPDNILVINNQTFKFSDFGISKRIPVGTGRVTQTRSGIGSDGYRPPESYELNAELSRGADIFALAIVLAQLISKGRHPYGSNPLDWQYHIRNSDEHPDFSILCIEGPKRDQLKVLLTRMLSKNPPGRPSIAVIEEDPFFLDEICDNSEGIRNRRKKANPQ